MIMAIDFTVVIRILQVLFGVILLGVSAGGVTHIDKAGLNFLVFVGAWVLLSLIFILFLSYGKSFEIPAAIFILEAMSLLFLIIGYILELIVNGSVIVVPTTLFNKSSSGTWDFCGLVLDGTAPGGLKGTKLHDAKVGCQCALAGAIFDGFSVVLWITSLILVIMARRRQD